MQLDAARIVTGAKRGTSHANIYKECGWPKLSERRVASQLVQFYKMTNDKTPEYLTQLVSPAVGDKVTNINLCNKDKLRSIRTRTSKYKNSFLPNTVNVWNNLDKDIIGSDSISAVKNKVFTASDNYHELNFYGIRNTALIHSQMSMECSNLNGHLFLLHVKDDPSCACGHRTEDSNHFFIQCPLYNGIRPLLTNFCLTNGIELSIEILLFGVDYDSELSINLFEIVHEYIKMSDRFH